MRSYHRRTEISRVELAVSIREHPVGYHPAGCLWIFRDMADDALSRQVLTVVTIERIDDGNASGLRGLHLRGNRRNRNCEEDDRGSVLRDGLGDTGDHI